MFRTEKRTCSDTPALANSAEVSHTFLGVSPTKTNRAKRSLTGKVGIELSVRLFHGGG